MIIGSANKNSHSTVREELQWVRHFDYEGLHCVLCFVTDKDLLVKMS